MSFAFESLNFGLPHPQAKPDAWMQNQSDDFEFVSLFQTVNETGERRIARLSVPRSSFIFPA
jgi:hypothetical protein